jgi:hypothetical protein
MPNKARLGRNSDDPARKKPHSDKTTYQDLARVVTWCGAEDYFRIADNPLPIRPNQLKMLVFIEDL